MIYKVDFSKAMWRYLYNDIYNRIHEMGIENNIREEDLKNRIIRLLADDKSLYLLVEIKDNSIVSHCLVNIINDIALIEQTMADRKRGNTFVEECLEYIERDIRKDHPYISRIALSTRRDEYRAIERKYGFSVAEIFMQREIKPVSTIEEEST